MLCVCGFVTANNYDTTQTMNMKKAPRIITVTFKGTFFANFQLFYKSKQYLPNFIITFQSIDNCFVTLLI